VQRIPSDKARRTESCGFSLRFLGDRDDIAQVRDVERRKIDVNELLAAMVV
jgi:hypothetical protein